MTREEMQTLLTSLGTCEDVAERRNMITQITDGVNGVFDQNDTLTASENKLKEDNEKLQEYNMKLFLRVGGQTKTPEPEEKSGEPLKYEDLFNEKGDLI